jgi:hypothetical protein
MKKLGVAFAMIALVLFWHVDAHSSSAGSIAGAVRDATTERPLAWVNIVVAGTQLGAATNEVGEYVIHHVPAGAHEVTISMMGYESVEEEVLVQADSTARLDVLLTPTTIPLRGVVVSGERTAEETSVSTQILDKEDLVTLQGIAEDPMKVLHTLPGIAGVTGGEEFAGVICVRGGDPEENLYLLDWAKVHWPWHMGGMKSFFNSELIEDIELLTGGFPAKYGGALSSVVNVTTREGRRDGIHGKANLSLINALGVVEGPVGPGGSYVLSARRSYFELMVRDPGYAVPSFYDIQGKVVYDLANGHKVLFSGLASGEDVDVEFEDVEPGQPESIEDRYRVYSMSGQWKWLVSSDIYSRLAYLGEKVNLEFRMSRVKMDINALVHGLREDVTHKVGSHELKYGFELHRGKIDEVSFLPLDPSDPSAWTDTVLEVWRSDIHYQGWKGGAYVQDTWRMYSPLWVTGGMRYDYDWVLGGSRMSPRLSLKYEILPSTHVRGAWGHYHQAPEEATEVAGGESLTPERATHYVLGLERRFTPETRGWIEAYRKDYSHLLTVDSLRRFSNEGSGFAHGIELFLQKEGNPSAWLSYSLSLAKRREYLDTREFYFDYDQRHLLSLVSNYQLGSWGLQVKWRHASGKPYTPIVGAVQDTAAWIPIEGDRNSARHPAYHRMDLRVDTRFHLRNVRLGVYVELLNLYNHRNVMGYSYNEDYSQKEPYYGLPIVPSIGLSAEF